jgi:hypothetical protein
MQSDIPNFDLYNALMGTISLLALMTHIFAPIYGMRLHKMVTAQRSLLWPLSLFFPFLVPYAGYITEKKVQPILKKKSITVSTDFGYTYIILYALHILTIVVTVTWFALLNSPEMNDLKVLCLGTTASMMFAVLSSLLSITQFYSKRKALEAYISKRKAHSKK